MKVIFFVEDNDKRILMDRSVELEKQFSKDRYDYIFPQDFSFTEFLRQVVNSELERKLSDRRNNL